MVASRALLEAFKFLRMPEITGIVDLVCRCWHQVAGKAELWAFLLEQELLVNRSSPMCQQDYPSLASKYISSRNDFIEFWRGAKQPDFLIFDSPQITLLCCTDQSIVKSSIYFAVGFRAVITSKDTVVITGTRENEGYCVLEYRPRTNTVLPLPCCAVQRQHHGIAAMSDSIYLSGGYSCERGLKSAEVMKDGEWSSLPDMNFPAWGHTMVVINSRLFTFGGHHDKAELFDGGEWRNLDLFLPWALADFGVVVVSFKQVLLIGGSGMFSRTYLYSLDLMTGMVVKMARAPPFRCKMNAACLQKHEVLALTDEGEMQHLPYLFVFHVKVSCKLGKKNHNVSLMVDPSDKVLNVIQKFRTATGVDPSVELMMYVNEEFAADESDVATAGIADGCEVQLVTPTVCKISQEVTS